MTTLPANGLDKELKDRNEFNNVGCQLSSELTIFTSSPYVNRYGKTEEIQPETENKR